MRRLTRFMAGGYGGLRGQPGVRIRKSCGWGRAGPRLPGQTRTGPQDFRIVTTGIGFRVPPGRVAPASQCAASAAVRPCTWPSRPWFPSRSKKQVCHLSASMVYCPVCWLMANRARPRRCSSMLGCVTGAGGAERVRPRGPGERQLDGRGDGRVEDPGPEAGTVLMIWCPVCGHGRPAARGDLPGARGGRPPGLRPARAVPGRLRHQGLSGPDAPRRVDGQGSPFLPRDDHRALAGRQLITQSNRAVTTSRLASKIRLWPAVRRGGFPCRSFASRARSRGGPPGADGPADDPDG